MHRGTQRASATMWARGVAGYSRASFLAFRFTLGWQSGVAGSANAKKRAGGVVSVLLHRLKVYARRRFRRLASYFHCSMRSSLPRNFCPLELIRIFATTIRLVASLPKGAGSLWPTEAAVWI